MHTGFIKAAAFLGAISVALGAFAAWLAAGALPHGDVSAEDPFGVDELGELGAERPLARRHAATRWGLLAVCHSVIMSDSRPKARGFTNANLLTSTATPGRTY